VDYGKKGKVTLVFDFERVADSSAVIVASTIKFEKPTLNGTSSEKSSRSTPMYVGKGGKLTLAPERQLAMFDRAGNISQPITKE
jgi:hypothetical protein